MKESFRSTRPITEFAVNVLARLTNFEDDPDQRELIERGLIEAELRDGMPWWRVYYNEVEGPSPRFARYADRGKEVAAVSDQIERWIRVDRVQPRDIVVVTMGRSGNSSIADLVVAAIDRRLRPLGLRAEQRTQAGFQGLDRTVAVTTPHSFKGYEAEVVCAVGLDAFQAHGRPLVAPLYVALTRARSYLLATASETRDLTGRKIVAALKQVGDLSAAGPVIDDRLLFPASGILPVLRQNIDQAHHAWLDDIAKRFELSLDPVETPEGEIAAEPTFVARVGSLAIAVFGGAPPTRAELLRLKDLGYRVATIGESM